MKKIIAVLMLSLLATASYAQSTITFNVEFNQFYAASAGFVPALSAFDTDPVTLTGTVVLTAVASGTQLTGGNEANYITLNGEWNSAFSFNPANTQQVFTYENATFGLFGEPAYFANDVTSPAPQFLATGTAVDGLLSDLGPASQFGGTCPLFDFGGAINCASANPQITFEEGLEINEITDDSTFPPATEPLYPTLADAGWHPLISGSATQETLNGGAPLTDLSHDNGLDGFYFEGGLDTNVPGAIVPGGIVRIVMTSASGSTMYVLEGTTSVVPVPAAVWLFGSALGLLAWVRRRVAA